VACENSGIASVTAAVKFLRTATAHCIIAATFQYCCPMYPTTFCWIYCLCPSAAHVLKDNMYIFACVWYILNLLQGVPEKHGSCS